MVEPLPLTFAAFLWNRHIRISPSRERERSKSAKSAKLLPVPTLPSTAAKHFVMFLIGRELPYVRRLRIEVLNNVPLAAHGSEVAADARSG